MSRLDFTKKIFLAGLAAIALPTSVVVNTKDSVSFCLSQRPENWRYLAVVVTSESVLLTFLDGQLVATKRLTNLVKPVSIHGWVNDDAKLAGKVLKTWQKICVNHNPRSMFRLSMKNFLLS